jgi:hypothetical protein
MECAWPFEQKNDFEHALVGKREKILLFCLLEKAEAA